MIAQSKAPIKKGDKLVEHLFRHHPIHGLVLAPWGVFGAFYVLETEAEYERLKKEFTAIAILSLIGLMIYRVTDDFFHLNPIVAFILIAVLPSVVYAKLTYKATRQLSIAEPRLPFWLALRQYAREQKLWRLWLGNIFFSICSWGIGILAQHAHHDNRVVLWGIFFLSGFVALTYSLMIFLRESAPKRMGD